MKTRNVILRRQKAFNLLAKLCSSNRITIEEYTTIFKSIMDVSDLLVEIAEIKSAQFESSKEVQSIPIFAEEQPSEEARNLHYKVQDMENALSRLVPCNTCIHGDADSDVVQCQECGAEREGWVFNPQFECMKRNRRD